MRKILLVVLVTIAAAYLSESYASNEKPFENPDTYALVKANSIDSLPPNQDYQFHCLGPIDTLFVGLTDYRIRYSFQAPEAGCVEITGYDFSDVDSVADIPIQLDNLNDLLISNMEGSSQTTLEMIIFRESLAGNCGDPGSGVYIPSVECPGLVIFDGNDDSDTRVASCVGRVGAKPSSCPVRTVVGHTVYAKRLIMPDLGVNKEKFSQLQATTINTMISPALGPYKNVIISFDEVPGSFDTSNSRCSDVTASENSDVFIVQADSDIALSNPGRYCTFKPNIQYYVNTRFDLGLSENCGKVVDGLAVVCTYDIVERLVNNE